MEPWQFFSLHNAFYGQLHFMFCHVATLWSGVSSRGVRILLWKVREYSSATTLLIPPPPHQTKSYFSGIWPRYIFYFICISTFHYVYLIYWLICGEYHVVVLGWGLEAEQYAVGVGGGWGSSLCLHVVSGVFHVTSPAWAGLVFLTSLRTQADSLLLPCPVQLF